MRGRDGSGGARRWLAVALLAATALTASACGGDDDDEDATDASTPAAEEDTASDDATEDATEEDATEEPVDTAADEAAVRQVTTDFFAAVGASDFATATPLLENGSEHEAKFAHCDNVSKGVSVNMKTVTFDGADAATTTYEILINGAVVLPEAGGTAIRDGDSWLVGETGYLSLYDAAKDSCTGPPPPA